MIKRYRPALINKSEHGIIMPDPGMTEDPNGQYVLYTDYEDILIEFRDSIYHDEDEQND